MKTNKKHIPTPKQEAAFKKVVDAIKAAQKAGLVFFGKQFELTAYTKEANRYVDEKDFGRTLNGQGRNIPCLSARVLHDSGADDYSRYITDEDDPRN